MANTGIGGGLIGSNWQSYKQPSQADLMPGLIGSNWQSYSQPSQPISQYSGLLGANNDLYSKIVGTYASGQNNISNTMSSVSQGYDSLNSDVMNILGMGGVLGQNGNWGVAKPAFDAIMGVFKNQQGQTKQDAINAGLGNSTDLPNMLNQGALMAGRAIGGLGSSLAQTAAGYMSQGGLAKLAAMMQALGMSTGLTGQEGGTLGGILDTLLARGRNQGFGGGGGGGGARLAGGGGSFGNQIPDTVGAGYGSRGLPSTGIGSMPMGSTGFGYLPDYGGGGGGGYDPMMSPGNNGYTGSNYSDYPAYGPDPGIDTSSMNDVPGGYFDFSGGGDLGEGAGDPNSY